VRGEVWRGALSFTDEELRAVCWYWQRMLRLCDWTIEIRYGTYDEMRDGNAGAMLHYMEEHRHAKLYVLRPPQRKADTLCAYDVERDIVHELCHIPLLPFDGKQRKKRLYINVEVAVNAYADALLLADRGYY